MNERKLWYAVIYNDDYDWDLGSFDLEEAKAIAKKWGATKIAVIDAGYDEEGNATAAPFCAEVINRDSNGNFYL